MISYLNHRGFLDLTLSLVVGLLVWVQPSAIPHIFVWQDGEGLREMLLAVAASSLTLMGFVLAASTFLVSHLAHEQFTLIRQSGGYRQLLQIIRSTMWRLLLLSGVAGLSALAAPDYRNAAITSVAFCVSMATLGTLTLTWAILATISLPLKRD